MPKSSFGPMILKLLIFFMWLFDDSGDGFSSFMAIKMIVCQRKYSFVQRKSIFLYKTVINYQGVPR